MDEYAGKVISCVSTVYGTGAVVTGLIGLRSLVERREQEEATMDRFLLKVSAFFVMVYTSFTVAVGLHSTGHQVIAGELHVITGLLNILQTFLQVVFIELLLSKTIR